MAASTPAEVLADMRRTVDVLKAEVFAPAGDEFVQEVLLQIESDTHITPPEPILPLLEFGPETWTHVSGTFGTVDDRGRTALVVGEGTTDPATWATFTAPLAITAGSDWTIRLWATGEINDRHAATIVDEAGGMDLRTTQSHGIYEGTIRSSTVVGLNLEAWSPSIVDYTIRHTGGVTSIYVAGVLAASGAGLAASGAGTVTVVVPPGAAIFALHIYDQAVPL